MVCDRARPMFGTTAALFGACFLATCWFKISLHSRRVGPVSRFLSTKASEERYFNASMLGDIDHLIIVAGHAVLDAHTESLDKADYRDSVWYLLDYQRNQDLPHVLVSHIQRGVSEAAADPNSLLIFSGGQTRTEAGPTDEGSSYYRVAQHYEWWGHKPSGSALSVQQRTATEDFASDSFQNLLFSICRFFEVVGRYPAKISVVGFGFKEFRFTSLHRTAIRFPIEHFKYIGVEPEQGTQFDFEKAAHGEREQSITPFLTDPYGCSSSVLSEKRKARNPFMRTPPYPLSCPALRNLLMWCKPEYFPDALPWDSAMADSADLISPIFTNVSTAPLPAPSSSS